MMKRKIITLDLRLTWSAIENVAVQRAPISGDCAASDHVRKRNGVPN